MTVSCGGCTAGYVGTKNKLRKKILGAVSNV